MAKGPRARFGKILLKLSLLGEVSPSFIEKCFFKGGLENISEDFNNGPLPETQSGTKTNKSKDATTPANQSKYNNIPANQSAERTMLPTENQSKTKQAGICQSDEDEGFSANQSKDSVDDSILSSIKQEVEEIIEIVI